MDKLKKLLAQAVKFGLVGVLNTVIDYAVYSGLLFIPFFKRYYVLAQAVGYAAGLCNSLVLNKRWTFAQREAMTKVQLLLFLAVNLAALLVSTLVLVLTQETLGMNPYLGKIVATVFSMAVNFIGNKLIVFRK